MSVAQQLSSVHAGNWLTRPSAWFAPHPVSLCPCFSECADEHACWAKQRIEFRNRQFVCYFKCLEPVNRDSAREPNCWLHHLIKMTQQGTERAAPTSTSAPAPAKRLD